MIPIQTLLALPDECVPGLMSGSLIKTGSVIQKAAGTSGGGEIVCWLREISTSPLANNQLITGAGTLQLLGLAGNVASVLNLGATVAFGIAILSKLKTIERKIDKLQWTVEIGFANTLRYLETLTQFETLGDAKAAAELAWGAQLFEPDSPKRISRITEALGHITSASQKTLILIENEMQITTEKFNKVKNGGRYRLQIVPQTLFTIDRFRFACSVSALKASIYAEDNDLESASSILEDDTKKFDKLLNSLGYAFLRGGKDSYPTDSNYDDLLSKKWKGIISPERIEEWAKRFDPNLKNIYSIIEYLRDNTGSKLTRIDDKYESLEGMENFPKFADLLDGAYEDVQRLKGRVAEYKYALSNKLTISEYRDMLKVNDTPDNINLVFLKPGA